MELLTRFLTCPSKRLFIRMLPNIIDLIALVSFYADLTIYILGVSVSVMFLISLILSLLPCLHPHTTQIGEMQAMSTGFCVESKEPGCKHWQICVYPLGLCFTRSRVCRREKVDEESVIMVVDLIRIFRILQISKLIRHLTEFQLLVKSRKSFTINNVLLVTKFETIRASARELYIWVYCVAMFVIIFGTVMYYAER